MILESKDVCILSYICLNNKISMLGFIDINLSKFIKKNCLFLEIYENLVDLVYINFYKNETVIF